MDKKLLKQLECVKRSILYDINKRFEELRETFQTNSSAFGTNNIRYKEMLGITALPFKTLEEFSDFDKTLYDNLEKEQAMVQYYIQEKIKRIYNIYMAIHLNMAYLKKCSTTYRRRRWIQETAALL